MGELRLPPDDFLTVDQLSESLRQSPRTVQRMLNDLAEGRRIELHRRVLPGESQMRLLVRKSDWHRLLGLSAVAA